MVLKHRMAEVCWAKDWRVHVHSLVSFPDPSHGERKGLDALRYTSCPGGMQLFLQRGSLGRLVHSCGPEGVASYITSQYVPPLRSLVPRRSLVPTRRRASGVLIQISCTGSA